MRRIGACMGLLFYSLICGATMLHTPAAFAAANLEVDLDASESEVRPGEDFVYRLRIRNTGNESASGATAQLTLDRNLDFRSASSGGRNAGGTVNWEDLNISPGSTRTLNATVSVKSSVNQDQFSEIKSTATAESGFDQNTISLDAEDTREEDHDFDISMRASEETVEPGDLLTYTIRVRNKKNRRARNAMVQLTLDSELEFSSATVRGRNGRRNSIEWKDLVLDANETVTLSASAEVSDQVEEDDVIRSVVFGGGDTDSVSTQVEDPDVDDNDDDRNVSIRLVPSKSILEPDDTFTYTVQLTNNNRRKVNGLTVNLRLAEHLEFLSASNAGAERGSDIVWDDIDIEGDRTRTLTASIRVSDEVQHNEKLESTIFSEGIVREDSVRIQDNRGFELVALHAFADEDTTEPGGTISYTIRIRNQSDDDETLDVTALLDPLMELSSASDGGALLEKQLVEWEDFFLKQNETRDLTLKVKIDDELAKLGDVARIIIRAGQDERHILTKIVGEGEPVQVAGRQFSGFSTPLPSSPGRLFAQRNPVPAPAPVQQRGGSLVVQKNADKNETQPGSIVTYTITVQNPTNGTYSNLRVIDSISFDDLTLLNLGGGAESQEGLEWTIRTLEPGQTWETRYQVRIMRSLNHGSVVRSSVRVEGESPLLDPYATVDQQTNVILRLPQAGFGTYVAASALKNQFVRPAAAREPTRAPAPQESAPATVTVARSYSLPVGGWILVILGGILLGGIIATKRKS